MLRGTGGRDLNPPNPEASLHPFLLKGEGNKDVKYLLDLNEIYGIVM